MRWRDETQLAAEHLGYEVIETDGVTDWQGWGVHLLRRGDDLSAAGCVWAVLAWGYGSCSGCDRYEDKISYDDRGDPERCAQVFGELIEDCFSEEEARRVFADRKGW